MKNKNLFSRSRIDQYIFLLIDTIVNQSKSCTHFIDSYYTKRRFAGINDVAADTIAQTKNGHLAAAVC